MIPSISYRPRQTGWIGILAIIFLPWFLYQAQGATPSAGEAMMKFVRGIEQQKQGARGEFVKSQLHQMGVHYFTMPVDTIVSINGRPEHYRGENIIVRCGSGAEKIVVGAHFDAVFNAPGANDNGSGVAVLLQMIGTLRRRVFNHVIDFCFFDHEEPGMIGSEIYVRQRDRAVPLLAMLNVDVAGAGNEVFIAPVNGDTALPLLRAIRRVENSMKHPYNEEPFCLDSDYESFADAGISAVSISVVPEGDGKRLSDWSRTQYKPATDSTRTPLILSIMHTKNDTSDRMSPSALTLAYTFTSDLLLLLDQNEH